MNQTITQLGKQFKECKDAHDELTKQIKELELKWQTIEASLMEAMAEEGIKSIRLDGVGMLSLRVSNYLSVNAANKPEFFEYLKESGNEGLLKLDVNPRTLTAFLGKHLEELIEKDGGDQIEARQKALDFLKEKGANYFTKRDIALKGE